MNTQLVEILPRELKFVVEVKKQSSCAVYLTNVTEEYVAFKVKTTSPKRYCVRPNVGIIKPKSTYDFTVTMQAQKSASSEMLCRDKFLIQITTVPFGTPEEEITPAMFARDSEKYIEETKLRVALTSAPTSPEILPVNNEIFNEEASHENLTPKEPHTHPVNGVSKQEPSYETIMPEDKLQSGVHNFPPPDMLIKRVGGIKVEKNIDESRSLNVMDNLIMKSVPAKEGELYLYKDEKSKDVDETKLKLTKDIEDFKFKIRALDSKLVEAENTITKLRDENMNTISEKETLRQELIVMSRRKSGARKVRVGFPPLFVLMVAVIGLMIGLLFRA